MFDTYICVVGTVLNRPEKRLTTKTNSLVASFRVASHPRRYDRENNRWVDAPNLRIKVNCWRRLAEGVCSSLIAGDPVVVWGRIVTQAWKNEQGEARISYELEADSVGHDLARGTADFRKTRTDLASAVIEDDDTENRVNGERTQSVEERLGRLGHEEGHDEGDDSSLGDDLGYGDDYPVPDAPVTDLDAMTILRGAGLDPTSPDGGGGEEGVGEDGAGEESTGADGAGEEELSGAAPDSGGTAGRGRRRGRQPVPA
jgi:single-strand DNA-binding protein